MYLEKVNSPSDIRSLPLSALSVLASEIRDTIIEVVAEKGGHLGSNLGVVELTIALHYVFNMPDDKLVWDVGHQCYPHKMLTNRKLQFKNIRQFGQISGFPKISESPYDAFGTGHSSTSISAVLGMAMASALEQNFSRNHIAVIGDASIVSGMAFEALNFAGTAQANMLIILNDNGIGIDESIGALKEYFSKLGKKSISETFFKTLNINYLGSVDGHNLSELISAFEKSKKEKGIKLIHARTTKGKGLQQAENDQVTFHSPPKFDKLTGEKIAENAVFPDKYQDVFGQTLVELAERNPKIVAITPAMLSGSSLHWMQQKFPERVFDVGIAEQHAVTFAAGWATQGFLPFCVIYATFLQRAYDQLIHDVALQGLPVVICVDRAGIVGEDGATHHGVFDMAFLRCIPNLIIASPRNATELRNMLYTSQLSVNQPFIIRYPRGRCLEFDWKKDFQQIEIGKGVQLKKGSEVAVISIGIITEIIEEKIKKSKNIEKFALFDIRFLKPLDEKMLHHIFKKYKKIIAVEEGSKGGLGSALAEFKAFYNYANELIISTLPDEFISNGSAEELRATFLKMDFFD